MQSKLNNWISNLKRGDYVFLHSMFGTSLRKVEKITPAGNVKVNGMLFNQYGVERKADKWRKCTISEVTPETFSEFRKRMTINKALKLMQETKEINFEQAEEIIKILDNSSKDK